MQPDSSKKVQNIPAVPIQLHEQESEQFQLLSSQNIINKPLTEFLVKHFGFPTKMIFPFVTPDFIPVKHIKEQTGNKIKEQVDVFLDSSA